MLQTITDAIRNRLVLTFTYSGITRIVEPHAVGISKAGNLILRCYQTHGGHITPGHVWDLCEVHKMGDLRATGDTFLAPRPGYRRGDKHMTHIYAEL